MEGRLPWRSDIRYHQGEAAHFRALASTATTARVKAHLLERAKEHERKVHGEPAPVVRDEQARSGKPVRF
jgi:hypothetical protein